MPDLSPYLPTAMFLLGMVMLITILLRRYYRHFGKRRQDDRPLVNTARCKPDRQQPLIDAPPNILRWQVEMHETARDLKAELDTKMLALQQLIAIAQDQAGRLEEAVAEARRLGISSCRDTLDELERVVRQEAGELDSSSAGGLGNLPKLPEPAASAGVVSEVTRQEICDLAAAGLDAAAIADQTGHPAGDVEMVLSLR